MSNILWTKVKFCRNLKGVMFSGKITSESQEDVLKLGLDACSSCGLKGESIEALSDKVINNLIASGKLENDFASSLVNKGYASNDETNVKINGKNHIEIMAKDLNLYDAYSKAKKIDKQLCNKLHFAYSDKYGFLGPDIKNIGSGMQISAMVMLPALTKLNAVRDLPKSNDKLIFNIKPIDLQSGIYLITTGATLGYGEKQICELTSAYINNVVKREIEM
ncbi:MAG: hypothetical protein IJ358_02515, partial [Clostridia bacterium]|nr:hypothetical protein [Clostridia bacterium]